MNARISDMAAESYRHRMSTDVGDTRKQNRVIRTIMGDNHKQAKPPRGAIKVYDLGECMGLGEDPFQKEERNLTPRLN